jgi:hypothetical protein
MSTAINVHKKVARKRVHDHAVTSFIVRDFNTTVCYARIYFYFFPGKNVVGAKVLLILRR